MSLAAALIAAGPLHAQTGQVSGTVTSAEGARPLSGATVSVVGTALRTVTGPDGRYTLSGVRAGQQRVSAALIGHAPATLAVTVAAGQTATLDFTLSTAAVALEGVVAIGYGERRVRDVTGAVQAVGEEEFNTGRVVSPEQLIQGKVAGVQVVDDAAPGGGVNIRIRGGTSVNASNEPLFVVDGVPLQPGGGLSAGRNPLNFINPEDIARMTVLKDASSTAIYGSRGANGVIIIETKTGSSRGPRFEYGSSVSTSTATRGPDMLSAAEFRAAVAEHASSRVQFLGSASTDWRDAIEQDATGQEHSLAVSGAGEDLNYRLSLNYLDQSGVVRGSATERISAALSYNQRLFDDRLSIRASLRGARTDDVFTPVAVLGSATIFDPTQPIRTEGGAFFENTQFRLGPNNPLAELAFAVDEGRTYRSVGSLEGRYRMPFLEALSTTVRLGYDVAESERRGFQPSTLQAQVESDHPGFMSRSTPSDVSGLIDAFANYASRLDALNGDIDATAGYSYQSTRRDRPYFEASGLQSDLLGPNGLPRADEVRPTLTASESKLASFFGRVNYTLADRYLLTVSVRRDGSSRFAPGRQWGTFPAVALGWRVNEEPWFENLGWLSELKLRASWGVNGNQEIGDYLWISSYEFGDERAQVQFGNQFVPTIRPTAVDPEIRWEETTSYNLGFDYGLFDNRVTGSVEYYFKDTDDLLFRIPVAAGTNVRNFVTTNVGEVHNRGLELSVNARVLEDAFGGLSWDASLNASTNRNRLVEVNREATGGSERVLVGGISGGVGSTIQVLEPGSPVNAFFVFEHRRDGSGRPVYADTDGDGDIDNQDLYVDQNGDGRITEEDRRAFHSPQAQWILGHTSQFRYGNFDLGMTLRAYLGNYVYNNTASAQGFYNNLNAAGGLMNLHRSVLETGFVTEQYFSDVYVEDASFLRMDNLTLGYTLPNFRGVRQLRLFGTVQNVFTLTGYSGVDPTSGLNGIDNNLYPRSRTFTAGVNVGF
jgi:iron complex outermembrane receptor protein